MKFGIKDRGQLGQYEDNIICIIGVYPGAVHDDPYKYLPIEEGDNVEAEVHYDGDKVSALTFQLNDGDPIVKSIRAEYADIVKDGDWEFFVWGCPGAVVTLK